METQMQEMMNQVVKERDAMKELANGIKTRED